MTTKTKALTTITPNAITTPQAVDWKRAAEDWLANLGSDRTRRAYRADARRPCWTGSRWPGRAD